MQSHGLVAGEKPEVRLGDRLDFVDIRAENGILIIEIVGAPDTARIYQGMQHGHAGGWIGTAMPTLVDVSKFHGKIDWHAIKAVSQMADWGVGAQMQSRVAYISPDRFFALVIKAVSIMFPRSTHRLFSSRAAAMAWLQASLPH
jgi:hypothetical protein